MNTVRRLDCPHCRELNFNAVSCRDCGFDIARAMASIARLAHWEIIAAGPAATVTGHAVTLPRRRSTLRVWGPRDSIERTLRPQY